ncbi:phosphoribosylglycinamide formyltransferase [Limoniibacter endophyticus]|uniref:Phosphoribosylglycinamide formyltransferase n=1 Tax=Limoniibacter endophyticus TaxID=1565040 RepID=A0A8J3DMT7_9HYPH|nr:phosphoribosylglycinamide formyltransferase [Limoniibacter endophyticus]GHC68667.1 phosphoribosylglycinamide formyltransferase [Limoniibacter endophyticus]
MSRKKVVVLISGRGSNMNALIEASHDRDYPAEIIGVISDQADAPGLKAAQARGLSTVAVPRSGFSDKPAHEAALVDAIERMGAEIICLAGFMRLLSAEFVARFEGRMINIHPSLLPLFKGLDTHKRAIEAGMRVHGTTVHYVTAEMDGGPVIAQAAVPVLPNDTEASLGARVLKAEHAIYPLALALVASGKAAMQGGKTIYSGLEGMDFEEKASIVSPASWRGIADLQDLARITP